MQLLELSSEKNFEKFWSEFSKILIKNPKIFDFFNINFAQAQRSVRRIRIRHANLCANGILHFSIFEGMQC